MSEHRGRIGRDYWPGLITLVALMPVSLVIVQVTSSVPLPWTTQIWIIPLVSAILCLAISIVCFLLAFIMAVVDGLESPIASVLLGYAASTGMMFLLPIVLLLLLIDILTRSPTKRDDPRP